MALSIESWFVLAAFVALAKGNYHYETFKVFNFAGDSEPYRKPWFFDDFATPFARQPAAAESEGYAFEPSSSYETMAQPKSSEGYESPAEAYFVAGTKKIPREDKSFKKSISPFYTLTDSDNEKYKEIVLKAGVPYCQETKSKPPKKRYRRDAMTCYKCKDPKNGATYEQCSYSSEPQETVRVDEYVPLPAIFRYRRSTAAADGAKKEPTESKPGYRFGEEYFEPAASDEAPASGEKKVQNCKKVVKDSMVCMVCKDPETNGKYEQCSYTNQPKDKAYGYSESSSFGLPQVAKDDAEEAEKPAKIAKIAKPAKRAYGAGDAGASYGAPSSGSSGEKYGAANPELEKYFEEQTAAIKQRVPQRRTFDESDEGARLESGSENAKDGDCKKVAKDSMVCTVCKDPKTGGSYEQCSYAHNPNDKVYQFSRQKYFGYPEEGGKAPRSEPAIHAGGGEKNQEYRGGYDYPSEASREDYEAERNPAKYREQPTEQRESHDYAPYTAAGADDVKSESELVSDEARRSNGCEKVERDGMTCSVCKDPKTGGNSEQCSYAYQPNDKVFSFSRAKSFGSPGSSEGGGGGGGGGEGGSPSEGYGASEFGERGGYGVASDAQPRQVASAAETADPEAAGKIADFFSTAEKKKEIEKVLSEFQQEDRSKCKKVIRDKLTCFQCKGEDGMQKEECIFVADQKPAKERLAYREVKEFEAGDSVVGAPGKKRKRKARKIVSPTIARAEPASAASEYRERRSEPSRVEAAAEEERESEVEANEAIAEADPYDFAAETKPTYDKVLGITLPRYMLTTSEHEAEFDEVVASDRV